jgi:hypothetical protein
MTPRYQPEGEYFDDFVTAFIGKDFDYTTFDIFMKARLKKYYLTVGNRTRLPITAVREE